MLRMQTGLTETQRLGDTDTVVVGDHYRNLKTDVHQP